MPAIAEMIAGMARSYGASSRFQPSIDKFTTESTEATEIIFLK
jgi:hypothetical protein